MDGRPWRPRRLAINFHTQGQAGRPGSMTPTSAQGAQEGKVAQEHAEQGLTGRQHPWSMANPPVKPVRRINPLVTSFEVL